MGELLDFLRSYYAALNEGDVEAIASFFCPEAIHYYTRLEPHAGARGIAEHAVLARTALDGRWWIEAGLDDGEQACVEWTMTWRDPDTGAGRVNRGAEFYTFDQGRILEVRAYHHAGQKNPSGELIGFDHAGRGYMMASDQLAGG